MVCLLGCAQSEGTSLAGSSRLPDQKQVIASFVEGEDVFMLLPTGYRKAFCFRLRALNHRLSIRSARVFVHRAGLCKS